ncbi:general transcription factor II-I repeat domain-containing protein 2-like [Condylostylus longicornis]|uniref:general transcription factor II-I repeat domain-containing protein 2-like n=1 Tax=Condylostylus longicornis TaxID=2530218 RepID=UPI00244E1344|nr:general transcription factor II-I repeat domain-containing protein 2-like [Condylostylus longicornis]
MSHVMAVVVTTINSIKNNALKHRQFQDYLRELESEYSDLLFYAKIWWFSRGKCLERFWNLREEIRIFMKENGHDITEFYDEQWLLDLCFLTDITTKLNDLNLKLQGENKLITDCYQDIKSFVIKLKFYESQLKSKIAIHFPLLNHFNSEQKDFAKYENEVTNPYNEDVQSAPSNFQIELIDLQSNTELKYMFEANEFYRKYIHDDKFPNLKQLVSVLQLPRALRLYCHGPEHFRYYPQVHICILLIQAASVNQSSQSNSSVAFKQYEYFNDAEYYHSESFFAPTPFAKMLPI